MLDEKVKKAMDVRLKAGEIILWAETANASVRAKSEGLTLQDKAWQYIGATFLLALFLFNGYESIIEQSYVRFFLVLFCFALLIYVILFSRGHLPNPFVKNNVGEQFHHYVITTQRIRLFQKNINRGLDIPMKTIGHAFIMYPKAENFLTISFLNDPDEDRMLSLNGVEDFSVAINIINKLVGYPRKKE